MATHHLQQEKKRITGKELIDTFGRKILFSAMGVGLGLFAFHETQRILRNDEIQALGKACESAPQNMAEFEKHYHPYEPYLGGSFVCLLTQFLFRLVLDSPAGFIVWNATFCTALPLIVMIVVEAGRSGARGPVRFPSVILLLGQFLGISVAFPGLWIPFYIFGRCSQNGDPKKGTVAVARARLALVCALPGFVLTALTFYLDPVSRNWTLVAGCLGGPLLALVPIVCWTCTPPEPHQASHQMVHSVVTSYVCAGILSFIMWAVILAVIALDYSEHHYSIVGKMIYADVWGEAHGFVRFMLIDAMILYLGALVYIGYFRLWAAVDTLLSSIVFGPGAAIAATLASLEMERSPICTPPEAADAAAQKHRRKKTGKEE